MSSAISLYSQIEWRTSSFCASNTCVEVAMTPQAVLVRDSKEPGRQPLIYTKDEWLQFVAGVKSGEFDFS